MNLHPVDMLLPEWGHWCRRENGSSAGYSQVQYSEYVARSSSASTVYIVDPDVMKLDEIIKRALPAKAVMLLVLRFVDGLPDKTASIRLRISRPECSRFRNDFVLPTLRIAWDNEMCLQNSD